MKNSSTPFNIAAIAVVALFAAAALWVFYSHGFDLVVLVLLVAAGAAAVLMSAPAAANDPAIASTRRIFIPFPPRTWRDSARTALSRHGFAGKMPRGFPRHREPSGTRHR